MLLNILLNKSQFENILIISSDKTVHLQNDLKIFLLK